MRFKNSKNIMSDDIEDIEELLDDYDDKKDKPTSPSYSSALSPPSESSLTPVAATAAASTTSDLAKPSLLEPKRSTLPSLSAKMPAPLPAVKALPPAAAPVATATPVSKTVTDDIGADDNIYLFHLNWRGKKKTIEVDVDVQWPVVQGEIKKFSGRNLVFDYKDLKGKLQSVEKGEDFDKACEMLEEDLDKDNIFDGTLTLLLRPSRLAATLKLQSVVKGHKCRNLFRRMKRGEDVSTGLASKPRPRTTQRRTRGATTNSNDTTTTESIGNSSSSAAAAAASSTTAAPGSVVQVAFSGYTATGEEAVNATLRDIENDQSTIKDFGVNIVGERDTVLAKLAEADVRKTGYLTHDRIKSVLEPLGGKEITQSLLRLSESPEVNYLQLIWRVCGHLVMDGNMLAALHNVDLQRGRAKAIKQLEDIQSRLPKTDTVTPVDINRVLLSLPFPLTPSEADIVSATSHVLGLRGVDANAIVSIAALKKSKFDVVAKRTEFEQACAKKDGSQSGVLSLETIESCAVEAGLNLTLAQLRSLIAEAKSFALAEDGSLCVEYFQFLRNITVSHPYELKRIGEASMPKVQQIRRMLLEHREALLQHMRTIPGKKKDSVRKDVDITTVHLKEAVLGLQAKGALPSTITVADADIAADMVKYSSKEATAAKNSSSTVLFLQSLQWTDLLGLVPVPVLDKITPHVAKIEMAATKNRFPTRTGLAEMLLEVVSPAEAQSFVSGLGVGKTCELDVISLFNRRILILDEFEKAAVTSWHSSPSNNARLISINNASKIMSALLKADGKFTGEMLVSNVRSAITGIKDVAIDVDNLLVCTGWQHLAPKSKVDYTEILMLDCNVIDCRPSLGLTTPIIVNIGSIIKEFEKSSRAGMITPQAAVSAVRNVLGPNVPAYDILSFVGRHSTSNSAFPFMTALQRLAIVSSQELTVLVNVVDVECQKVFSWLLRNRQRITTPETSPSKKKETASLGGVGALGLLQALIDDKMEGNPIAALKIIRMFVQQSPPAPKGRIAAKDLISAISVGDVNITVTEVNPAGTPSVPKSVPLANQASPQQPPRPQQQQQQQQQQQSASANNEIEDMDDDSVIQSPAASMERVPTSRERSKSDGGGVVAGSLVSRNQRQTRNRSQTEGGQMTAAQQAWFKMLKYRRDRPGVWDVLSAFGLDQTKSPSFAPSALLQHELKTKSNSSMASSLITQPQQQQQQQQAPSVVLCLWALEARDMPSVGSMYKVIARRLRVSLYSAASGKFLGGVHTVPLRVEKTDDTNWKFSLKLHSDVNPFVVKATVDPKEQVMLYMELNVIYERIDQPTTPAAGAAATSPKTKSPTSPRKRISEIKCGHCLMEVKQFPEGQEWPIKLTGGTLNNPIPIGQEAIQRKLSARISRKVSEPTLIIKTAAVPEGIRVEQLPPYLVCPPLALGAIEAYQRVYLKNAALKQNQFDPVLKMFPKILESADILKAFVDLWGRRTSTLPSKLKRNANPKLKIGSANDEVFRNAVMEMYPLLTTELPDPKTTMIDPDAALRRENLIKKYMECESPIDFLCGKSKPGGAEFFFPPFRVEEGFLSM